MVTHVFYVAGFGDKCEWIEESFPQVSCREHEILSLGLTQQGLGCDGNVAMRLVIFGYLVIIISQYSILQTIHENPSTEQAAIDSICLPVFVL